MRMHLDISKCLQGLNNMYIDKENEQELFAKYNTPKHVQRHCDEVARVAVVIAERLKDKGIQINVDELRGAALVHERAKNRKRS